MALYYLQESGDRVPRTSRDTLLQRLIVLLGIVSLILLSLLQGLGALWGWERTLLHLLPRQWHPEHPKVILLQVEKTAAGYKPIDLALALRGLKKLHPLRIVLPGFIAADQEKETIPLIEDLITKAEEGGIRVIKPEIPTPEALYRPIPL